MSARKKDLSEYEKLRQDFEDFAYIVSHDLNAPIRHIRQFSEILFQRLEDKVDPDQRRLLNMMYDSLDVLENKLEGLLVYSRLNTREPKPMTVDCNQLARDTLAILHQQKRYDISDFESDPLPTLTADAAQLQRLFYYLLDNAFKFTTSSPQVRIACTQKKGQWQFVIRDQGIGIPADCLESAFKLFKRLNREDEFPGHGLGLTLARKILEKNGQKIWIESTPGEGTAVHFTWTA